MDILCKLIEIVQWMLKPFDVVFEYFWAKYWDWYLTKKVISYQIDSILNKYKMYFVVLVGVIITISYLAHAHFLHAIISIIVFGAIAFVYWFLDKLSNSP